jgi:hypothetical protein
MLVNWRKCHQNRWLQTHKKVPSISDRNPVAISVHVFSGQQRTTIALLASSAGVAVDELETSHQKTTRRKENTDTSAQISLRAPLALPPVRARIGTPNLTSRLPRIGTPLCPVPDPPHGKIPGPTRDARSHHLSPSRRLPHSDSDFSLAPAARPASSAVLPSPSGG